MKIPIKPSKTYVKHRAKVLKGICDQGPGFEVVWTKSLPFACNVRGILAHRIRSVTTHLFEDRRHHHIDYLCGNGCNVDFDRTTETIVDDPGERLLCDRCEAVAAILKLPSSDTLAGRHCHRGKLVAEQTCCLPPTLPKENDNGSQNR